MYVSGGTGPSLAMRFHFGAIPSSPDFVPDASWRSLREPSPWLEKLVVLPISVAAAVIVAGLWFLVTPVQDVRPAMSLRDFLLLFAGIVVVHELIHALVHPMAGRSAHSILGFWPAGCFFYANYDGELSRNRFVAVLLMPLLIMSIVPLLVSAIAQVSSEWVAFVSTFHAFLAGGDILPAGLVLFQIPATGIVRQKSWRTYWREQLKGRQ